MKRGDVWTARSSSGYGSKPRPVIIVQAAGIDSYESVVLCLLTSYESDGMDFRVRIEPSEANGLAATSWAMAEKIIAMPKASLGERIGVIDDETMTAIGGQLAKLLGL